MVFCRVDTKKVVGARDKIIIKKRFSNCCCTGNVQAFLKFSRASVSCAILLVHINATRSTVVGNHVKVLFSRQRFRLAISLDPRFTT